jgi:hypothetical protein
MRITGGCHRGRVTYAAEIDPERVSICHCNDCQKLTGAAYRVSTVARAEDFQLITGKPKQYLKYGDSGAPSIQYFCDNCGSPLYRTGTDSDFVGIRVGTVDQRAMLSPRKQIWCRSALPWASEIGSLPRFDTER